MEETSGLLHFLFGANIMACDLPDTQSKLDTRNIIIDQVGVKDICHPMIFVDKSNVEQRTIGKFTMTVELAKEVKGTHMSRFIEVLNEETPLFSTHSFVDILTKVSRKLKTKNVQVDADFTFFRNKIAPSSHIISMMDYQVGISGKLESGTTKIHLKAVVPVTSLCPCSKNISKYGAHNQRSHITINALIAINKKLWIEDLIDIAESCASSELYATLKREDEKVVTERAYENPAFVEDLVRDIATKLDEQSAIISYQLEAENFESIHNHSAYACIKKNKDV